MSWKIDPIDELATHERAWSAINSTIGGTPLLDFRFVSEAVRHFSSGHEKIARFERDGSPIAIALLARTSALSWQTLQPANAPIGFIVTSGVVAIGSLLRSLAGALGLQCGMVSITQQDPLLLPRPPDSAHLSTLDYILTPSMDVNGSFADFLASRSKNFRHNVSRQRNRLKPENISTRLEIVTASSAMAQAVADYSGLECASWKGEINSAVRMDEPQGHFYVSLMESFASSGEAAICRYFFNEHLVASDLCLMRAGTLIILKTAYDERCQGYSPAHLMRIDAFSEFFNRSHVKRVEFYGPTTEWHARLTEDTRRMYHVNYYRWRGLKLLHALRRTRSAGKADPSESEDSVHG